MINRKGDFIMQVPVLNSSLHIHLDINISDSRLTGLLCLVPGGLLFARRLYQCGSVSVMDVFSQRYGDSATALLFLIHYLSSLLYCAAILTALGNVLEALDKLSYM